MVPCCRTAIESVGSNKEAQDETEDETGAEEIDIVSSIFTSSDKDDEDEDEDDDNDEADNDAADAA